MPSSTCLKLCDYTITTLRGEGCRCTAPPYARKYRDCTSFAPHRWYAADTCAAARLLPLFAASAGRHACIVTTSRVPTLFDAATLALPLFLLGDCHCCALRAPLQQSSRARCNACVQRRHAHCAARIILPRTARAAFTRAPASVSPHARCLRAGSRTSAPSTRRAGDMMPRKSCTGDIPCRRFCAGMRDAAQYRNAWHNYFTLTRHNALRTSATAHSRTASRRHFRARCCRRLVAVRILHRATRALLTARLSCTCRAALSP